MSVDVSAVLALGRDLGKVGPVTVLRARRAMLKTANDIAATAKGLAPVDTGATRNSIGVTDRGTSVEIGPTTDYSPYLEFGTSRMPPRPFMAPALDRHAQAFEQAIDQLASNGLGL